MAKNILKSKGKKLTKEQNGFIERHYHRLEGYQKKYHNTFYENGIDINCYLVEILLMAAVSYYENGIDKTNREEPGHLSGYIRGYMQSHIKKFKANNPEETGHLSLNIFDDSSDSYFDKLPSSYKNHILHENYIDEHPVYFDTDIFYQYKD